MRRLGIIVVSVVAGLAAAASADPLTPPATATSHKVGQTFAYVLQGRMSQSIEGRDPFGHRIHQAGIPTSINGHESIAIASIAPGSGYITLSR